MNDDLHTAMAVAALSEPLKSMNDLLHTKKGRKDASRLPSLQRLQSAVLAVADVLGLPTQGFGMLLHEFRLLALARANMSQGALARLLEERATVRAEKNFARSDEIRQELAEVGIMLMDGAGSGEGAWRPGPPVRQNGDEEEEELLSS
eukprot:TRINITY_DN2215_c3_g2_i1.p1 TRINITY_DN2215_c3_g2~~TRINITY_DN2215_c3_g2_i1.p1  ORF type:complete len:148 (-),score=40.67 TRINITY_DN2215_c3_g2_i1:1549-1992(-)